LFDKDLGILIDQGLESLIIGGVLGHQFHLFSGNVAAQGFAVLTPLQVVIRPAGTLAHDTELAWLHVLDLSDLVEDLSRVGMFHGISICIYIY
jgi:hypothetical protein